MNKYLHPELYLGEQLAKGYSDMNHEERSKFWLCITVLICVTIMIFGFMYYQFNYSPTKYYDNNNRICVEEV